VPSISTDSVDFLLDSFDSKIKSVIDDIAPVKVRKNNGRQKAPWRNSTAVQNIKTCNLQKACKISKQNPKLVVHYNIYKDIIHAFNMELGKARQTFFSNIRNSNLNSTHTLFATVERLTNPPSQIPRQQVQ